VRGMGYVLEERA